MKLTWKIFAIVGILLIVITTVWYIFIPGDYDNFAKCLSEKGATMYGADWCGSCKEQKIMFGKSFKYVNYVECPENMELCNEKGIEKYPTWIINGETRVGVQSLQKLSEITECSLES